MLLHLTVAARLPLVGQAVTDKTEPEAEDEDEDEDEDEESRRTGAHSRALSLFRMTRWPRRIGPARNG
jgi:hypothetical protein